MTNRYRCATCGAGYEVVVRIVTETTNKKAGQP